jgi:redox-sensitive bicupin YhaK (pirin superfamily)
MGKIVIFDPDESPFIRPRDAYPPHVVPLIPDEELDTTAVRWHHPGGPDQLQMFEMRLEPGTQLAPHAHAADEIIAVLEGDLVVGRRSYGAGASFFVPGDTVYTVTAGPDGCRFFNFRAAIDKTYFTPEQALERKRSARDEDPER